MRTLNYKTINKEKMNVIYEDLLESFKSIKLQGAKPNRSWFSTLPKYHNLWDFSEQRFSIIFSIFKFLSIIIILICRKLGPVGSVKQKIKLPLPCTIFLLTIPLSVEGQFRLVNSGYFAFCRYSDTHNLHVSFKPIIVLCYSYCVHLITCNDCMLFTLCVFNTL